MRLLIIAYVFLITNVYSQNKILVCGHAVDSTNGKHPVKVSILDDINKVGLLYDIPMTTNDSLNSTKTDKNGYFEIEANLEDTIYFQSYGHHEQSYPLKYLLTRGAINIRLKPTGCVEEIKCEKEPKIYAFIAKKINVNRILDNSCDLPFYSKYKAKYEILENVYGNYPEPIIEFVSYEHAASRNYYDYKNVLLYVGDFCGELEQIRFNYDPVYKTVEGKWAIPCKTFLYKALDADTLLFKPEPIKFRKSANIKINKENSISALKKRYIEPYYQFHKKFVKPLFGNYPKEIFEIRKRTTLKYLLDKTSN